MSESSRFSNSNSSASFASAHSNTNFASSSVSTSQIQSGNFDEVHVAPKKSYFGRKVEKLRITTGSSYDIFTRTLKNFIMRRQTCISSAKAKLSEKYMQAKWGVVKKINRPHHSVLLLTQSARKAWLTELGGPLSDSNKINFKAFVNDNGLQDSLQRLVNHKPLTRALIRDNKLFVEEAMAIHTFLSPQGKAALEKTDSDIKTVMQSGAQSGLYKLPGFNGVTYSSIEAEEFEVGELKKGGIFEFPDFKVTAQEKHLFSQSTDVMLIIKSNKGKEVRDLANHRELGPVLFPIDTQFEVDEIKTVAGRTQITLRDKK